MIENVRFDCAMPLIIHTKIKCWLKRSFDSFSVCKITSQIYISLKKEEKAMKKVTLAHHKFVQCFCVCVWYVWHNSLICTEKIILARKPAWRVIQAIISSNFSVTCNDLRLVCVFVQCSHQPQMPNQIIKFVVVRWKRCSHLFSALMCKFSGRNIE